MRTHWLFRPFLPKRIMKILLFITFTLTVMAYIVSATTGGFGYGGGGWGGSGYRQGVAQVHMPHQLVNVLDLLTPLHIRIATDGVKHKPVVRFPVVEMLAHGQFNRPAIVHLVHGPGIAW